MKEIGRTVPTTDSPSNNILRTTTVFVRKHPLGVSGVVSGGFALDQIRRGNPRSATVLGSLGLLLVGLEGASVYSDKVERQRESWEANMDVSRFVDAPNPAANIIEKNLGIPFVKKPIKVIYTAQNQQIHTEVDPYDAFRIGRFLTSGEADAVSVLKYHTFFAAEHANFIDDLHENAHFLIDQINPEIEQLIENYRKPVKRKKEAFVGLEECLVAAFFNEGTATVMEYLTAIQHYYTLLSEGKPVDHFEQMILDRMKKKSNLFVRREDPLTGFPFSFKTNSVQDRDTLVNITELAGRIRSYEVSNVFTHMKNKNMVEHTNEQLRMLYWPVKFRIGANFTHTGLHMLMQTGMPLDEAIVAIVKHPPTTFDDLLDPERYFNEKLLGQHE